MANGNEVGWKEVQDLFQTWREDNERRSDEVLELWETVLAENVYKLGDECWMVYEQVCTAALDCNRLDIADQCLVTLSKQFPGSLRVCLLKAMKYECLERFDDAIEILNSIIKRNETNSTARKRKIAILKAQWKIPQAIKELAEYLKRFMSDQEAWMELSDLYILEQDYAKAAYCVEELILHNPHNHLYYQRYAEIRYTQGGFENLEMAKSYYCQAVKLNPNNMRVLFGTLLSSTNLASSPKCSAQKKKEYTKLALWAAKQISDRYQSKAVKDQPTQMSMVEGMLEALLISAAT